jgi:hypothetical protein
MSMDRRVASMVLLAATLLGCAAPAPAPEPTLAWQPPADWVIVSTTDGGLQLSLPPWLLVGDNNVVLFANEPPPAPGAQIPLQLMALGKVDDQPIPGQDLGSWLADRLPGTPGEGVPLVAEVVLPAGPAVRFERVDRVGTPDAWHILAYAIRTHRGIAYLQIDGPEASWAARAAEVELIALTYRLR